MFLFKQKVKPDDQVIAGLLKFFNINVPRCHAQILDHSQLKQPDFLY
jgi:hypothetical protein